MLYLKRKRVIKNKITTLFLSGLYNKCYCTVVGFKISPSVGSTDTSP